MPFSTLPYRVNSEKVPRQQQDVPLRSPFQNTERPRRRLVPDVLEQLLHFGCLVRRERQQRQTRDATEAPVVIHCILHTRDAQATDDALGGFGYTLLLLASQGRVTLFPRHVNLVARSRSAIGEREDRAHGAGIERRM